MKKIIVSACLLGTPCRYDGKSKPSEAVIALGEKYELVPVCPECLGGLPTPRTPSERIGDKVMMRDGRDVTENYVNGAKAALERARLFSCPAAILKARSPSCGSGKISDGSFSGNLPDRDGVSAELLKKEGIDVYTEEEIAILLKKYLTN